MEALQAGFPRDAGAPLGSELGINQKAILPLETLFDKCLGLFSCTNK